MLVVASRRLSSSVSSAMRFMLLDCTCFIAENVHTLTHVIRMCFQTSKHRVKKSFSLGNLFLLTTFEKLSAVLFNAGLSYVRNFPDLFGIRCWNLRPETIFKSALMSRILTVSQDLIIGSSEKIWIVRIGREKHAFFVLSLLSSCVTILWYFFCESDVFLRWTGSYKNILQNSVCEFCCFRCGT